MYDDMYKCIYDDMNNYENIMLYSNGNRQNANYFYLLISLKINTKPQVTQKYCEYLLL